MGLRDRLRLLVRPAGLRSEAVRPAPAPPAYVAPVALAVVIPQAVAQAPAGSTLLDVGEGPLSPGAVRLAPEQWSTLRGPVCVTSPADGGVWASAVAERLAALGIVSSWVQPVGS